jgi:hypothetical protein
VTGGGWLAFCARCQQPSTKLEAHHGDYAEPTAVSWIFLPCHAAVHFDEQPAAYWSQTTGLRFAAAVAEQLKRRTGRQLDTLDERQRHRLAAGAGAEIALRAIQTFCTIDPAANASASCGRKTPNVSGDIAHDGTVTLCANASYTCLDNTDPRTTSWPSAKALYSPVSAVTQRPAASPAPAPPVRDEDTASSSRPPR